MFSYVLTAEVAPRKTVLTHEDVEDLVDGLAERIIFTRKELGPGKEYEGFSVYAIPRGGIPVAYHLLRKFEFMNIVDDPARADLFVDDVIDSGETADHYQSIYPDRPPVFALVDKIQFPFHRDLGWVIFPWEQGEVGSIEDNVRRLLQLVGEDPNREGLAKTPERVARAWRDWTAGYSQDASQLLTTFASEYYDEMVLVRDLPFYSHCEHHLAPFFGTADIAYIPSGRIVGLSKLSRLLDVYAKRLQVQERLTNQIVEALQTHLQPRGAAVSIRARHLCMESRGVSKQGMVTTTTALRGVFREDAKARSEFLNR